MNDTLKAVGNIGAELAAAKADLQREMERHRKTWRQLEQVTGLLREIRPTMPRDVLELWCKDRDAALSQQAEPAHKEGFHNCRVIGDETVGIRVTAEPAPAQDERAIGEIVAFGPFLTEVKWSTEDGESPAVGTKLYVRGGRHE